MTDIKKADGRRRITLPPDFAPECCHFLITTEAGKLIIEPINLDKIREENKNE